MNDNKGVVSGYIMLSCATCSKGISWSIHDVRNISTAERWARGLDWGKSKGLWYCAQHNPIQAPSDLTVQCVKCSTVTTIPGRERSSPGAWLSRQGWRLTRDTNLVPDELYGDVRYVDGERHFWCPIHEKDAREIEVYIDMPRLKRGY